MTVGIWWIIKRLHTNSGKDDVVSRQAGEIYLGLIQFVPLVRLAVSVQVPNAHPSCLPV